MFQTAPLQVPIPGGPELVIILLVLVLLFGANKIPKLARSTGQAMGEFQKGRQELNQELEEMKEGPEADDSTTSSTATDDADEEETETESSTTQ
ncbi:MULTISPECIES: Sec-independent protein translocase subunit TatA/TatB [Halolamina]|uniref:Sec-independent protein translocase protein TatA n=1 Tax=Halolamina pelagica TaxID=699431 RepID=A0A1I5MZG3_9EURY|nr:MULTISPECIES: twin-arginine translocase TatA/TatE family subunit [Halolamina]NHX36236.1 twin-arginine translocase TatA/TatE family subunit [Halolamina sp. R1-12]SFP14953.1 sec-independent protein translocase protein TatA [Halolamina pelagica]